MSCCGMKRASLATAPTAASPATATSRPFAAARAATDPRPTPPASMPMSMPATPAAAPAKSPGFPIGTVRVRYLARTAVLVRGAASGASYRFSANQPVQAVQRADAEALVASGHFRREG